ncbi:MAG: hypothetical protein ABSE20_24695 [Acetobacteraceae bacterium]|jgi:hypothetical protein
MPTENLPLEDHVARYVRHRLIQFDTETKAPVGIFPDAFQLRPGERDLSVSWVEYFEGDRKTQMKAVAEHSELRLGRRDGFGVLEVAALAGICEKHGAKVRVLYEPTKDPSHSAIHRYPRNNVAMEAELANAAAGDLSLVVDIRDS